MGIFRALKGCPRIANVSYSGVIQSNIQQCDL
jgi:hypothetical protein